MTPVSPPCKCFQIDFETPVLGNKGCLWAQAFIWYCQFGKPGSAGGLYSLDPMLGLSHFTRLEVLGVALLLVTSSSAVTQSHTVLP